MNYKDKVIFTNWSANSELKFWLEANLYHNM